MKNVKGGGVNEPPAKCGHDISCADKQEFDDCGTSGNCQCTTVEGGGTGYYCRIDA